MTSSDREILIAIQGEIHELRMIVAEQDKRLTRLETAQNEQGKALVLMHEELSVQGNSIEMLSREIGFGFGGLAVIIAFVGVFVPMYLTRHKEESSQPNNGQSLLKDAAELFKLMRGDKPE